MMTNKEIINLKYMPTGVFERKKGTIPWNKGLKNPYSKETLLKMSKSQTGRKKSDETKKKMSEGQKGINTWSKGTKASNEAKKKMSDAKKGKMPKNVGVSFGLSGKDSPSWKGGITNDMIEYRKNYNNNLTDKKRKKRSWDKNKRNRLKRKTIENIGAHTYGEWELLKKQYNYTCPCCGLSEPFNQRSKNLTEDHIIPLSKGGSDLIENIQPLCLSCNIKKHTLIIKY